MKPSLVWIGLLALAGNCPAWAHDVEQGQITGIATARVEAEAKVLRGVGDANIVAAESVIDRVKLWPAGSTLSGCFFGGPPEMRKFFVDASGDWTASANFTFDFAAEPQFRDCSLFSPSQIRVSFFDDGNWSYVGTDSLRVPPNQPSLNIGYGSGAAWPTIPQTRLKGIILHELGHALGADHEHQSPEASCETEFDWQKIYAALGGPPNFWPKEKVDQNLRQLIRSPRLQITPYDRLSIMHYYFPAWMYLNGAESSCFVGENDTLSELDNKGIQAAYPGSPGDQQQLLAARVKSAPDDLRRVGVAPANVEKISALLQGIAADSMQIKVCSQVGTMGNGNTIIAACDLNGETINIGVPTPQR